MKRVFNLMKRISQIYVENFNTLYGPAIKAGVNPFL